MTWQVYVCEKDVCSWDLHRGDSAIRFLCWRLEEVQDYRVTLINRKRRDEMKSCDGTGALLLVCFNKNGFQTLYYFVSVKLTVRCTPAHWGFTHTHSFQFISNVVTAMASIETVVDRLALIWPTPLNASITFSHCVTCVSVFVCLRWLCVWLSDWFTEWISCIWWCS